MSKQKAKTAADLRSEYDLACPRCSQAETLSIVVSCTAILSIEGTDVQGDHDWDDTSCCFCDLCGHNGTVGEFRIISGKAVQP